LKERGFQPSSENVRRALEANARDPGVISGLRSDTAGTDPKTSSAPPVAGRTPVNEINTSVQPGDRPPGSGDAPAPVADTGSGGGLGALILGLLPGLLAIPGMQRNLGPDPNLKLGLPPTQGVVTGGDVPGVPQVEAPPAQIAAPPKQLAAPPAQIEAPVKKIEGPPPAKEAATAKPGEVIPMKDQSPVSSAIDKAVEPAANEVKPRLRVKAGGAKIPRVRVP